MSETHGHANGVSGQPATEEAPAPNKNVVSPYGKRAMAIKTLLVEKGIITEEDLRKRGEFMDSRTPKLGAKLIAKAWVDPAYKARLFSDPKSAAEELGVDVSRSHLSDTKFVVVENTDKVRNLTVCTLCSCYPRDILGRPPDWYKSLNYRQRAVIEPRAVIAEFGTEVPDDVEVRVHDSSANIRYLVMPQRPAGTEHMSEEELAELVTRDSMIGVSDPLPAIPAAV